MKHARSLRAAALAVASALAATSAAAQTTFYGTGAAPVAAFQAALDASALNELTAPNGTTTLSFGALGTATLSGASISGNRISESGSGAPAAVTFTFTELLNGFGGVFGGVGTCCGNSPFPAGTVRLRFFAGATDLGAVDRVFDTSTATFFGVVTPFQFDRVSVSLNSGDAYTLDDVRVGANVSAVPEPGTWALLASGLAGLGLAARRRPGGGVERRA